MAWSNMLEYFAGLALKHLYYGPVFLSIEFMADAPLGSGNSLAGVTLAAL